MQWYKSSNQKSLIGAGVGGVGIRWCFRLLVLVVLLAFLLGLTDGSPAADPFRRADKRSDGEVQLKTRHEWKRRHRKSSECRLGKARYSINEEWSPNLGPPFGVWSCVRCQCVPVQKKRRIVAKVRCKNIKQECPKVACPNAVILPGACCKTCPNSVTSLLPPPPLQDEPQEEIGGRDFAVLLNGRTTQPPMTTSRVATGRLSLRRGTLHFSFMLEEISPSPESIQFMRDTGEIIEILEAQPTPYEATNNRICGTWTRMPKEYKALLREEKLMVALVPPEDSDEDVISGVIARYVGVDSEVFSSLLVPTPLANQTLSGGGTAIISVDRKTDSLHVSLVFNGIFGPMESHNATISVELMPSRALLPVVDTVILNKIATDLNRVDYMTTLGDSSLRLLTRGHVKMRVWSNEAPELTIEGMVTSRVTCNVFSAVLSLPEPETVVTEVTAVTDYTPPSPPPYGAGWALLTLSNDGDFEYQVFVKGFSVSTLKLETMHRKGHRTVEDITPSYVGNWANGTYTRPTYRDLDALLRGKMEVVVSDSNGNILKGMLNQIAVTEALRSPQPVLLSSSDVPMAATVWMAVDSACVAHYDVKVAGPSPAGTIEPFWNLILRENDTEWDPRLDMTKMELETEVTGRELFAHTTRLSRLSLSRLGSQVTHLDLVLISSNNDTISSPPLSGLIKGVHVPPKCLLDVDPHSFSEKVIDPNRYCNGGVCIKQEDEMEVEVRSHKCKDVDNNVFEDATSWPSPANSCSMCMCTKGKIKCQDVICPSLQCEGAYTPSGACCPVCPGDHDLTDPNQVCILNDQRYHVGAVWYPFLVPKGFDKCATCTCQANPSGRSPLVKCSRSVCPTLHCPGGMIEHPPDSCCHKCRPHSATPPVDPSSPVDPDIINNPPLTDTEYRRDILERGGCVYRKEDLAENGKEWHPRVASFGINKCITCKCKDGNITCDSQQCPELTCQKMVHLDHECCPRCLGTTDLRQIYANRRGEPPRRSKKDKKKNRHRTNHRRNSG